MNVKNMKTHTHVHQDSDTCTVVAGSAWQQLP
jgi:hypothetical protein